MIRVEQNHDFFIYKKSDFCLFKSDFFYLIFFKSGI